MTHDKLPYEVRKNSNVINPNPVETIKISITHDESLSKSEKRRIELTKPKMTHDELLAKIEELDGQSNSSVMGFNTYRLPKDNEEPFITTLDWYHQTALESHKKDKALNKLSLDVQTLKQALRAVVELTKQGEYTTWDKSMVPMVDGVYDSTEADRWEKVHGHDIRLDCYPEYGCQLLLDPRDIIQAIEKELK